ncbi:protein BIG GRAIN 1-like E [Cucurbita pepo subsp. pepo]|uniref:protein BIG GRAIN 1-like E n=1 Tax=Cucurbita pepo subsp. pepo TaxID=3664 RepID=UPI000C9D6375|nr:protein BIG GRAIN 1-like E [Cucurbita pepo subsp. pepo]
MSFNSSIYIAFYIKFCTRRSPFGRTKMSLSSSEMINKKMFHHRRASKELEVFEAARYFSDYNETSATMNGFGTKFTPKVKKKDKGWIKGRISLDMQVKNILNLPEHFPQHSYNVEKHVTKEKKYKQPSSPGGRLASFLNSLFSHSSSKKKKSKLFAQSVEDIAEDESRTSKRRISISHFRSSNAAATDAKFIYSSSPGNNSGFRTPPPHVQTPTKSYKELLSFSKFTRHVKSAETLEKRASKQKKKNLSNCSSEKDRVWVEKPLGDEEMKKKLKKFEHDINIIDDIDDIDDGGETDSSSDLFELQIYDLDYYSNGLPVYESTDIDSIKRRNSISNGVC